MKTLCLVLLALCCAIASAQQKVVEFNKDSPCCKLIWVNGQPFLSIYDSGTEVIIGAPTYTGYQSGRMYSILVSVSNFAAPALDVDPARFSATALDRQHSVLDYEDMDKAAVHDYKHSNRVNRILGGLTAMGTYGEGNATITSSDGTTATVNYYDPAASAGIQARLAEVYRARQSKARTKYDETVSLVLRHTTVPRGMCITGSVSFLGPKSMKPFNKGTQIGVVDLPIGNVIYRFRN